KLAVRQVSIETPRAQSWSERTIRARATRGSAGRIEAAARLECRDDLVQAAVRKASEVKSNHKVCARDANRKREGRLRFRKRPSYLTAVSRILSHSSLRAKKLGDDHLSQSRFRGTARSRNGGTVMRRYPRIITDRLSSLCFVLHRMGFFLPRELLRER